ncbi:NAD-aldehyde dehydrogenase [Stereum hirsutum FP-91666 SS1]|uniref:NAD-aldehyde dehydrogenase n=1 Tax=Stereum hirsutum (strain FP-91666) TaxID=721885 RepID=UPI000440AF1B|nr:NAD-aldehyde dehydrogenase [Stereum hirsutum FP-91666 SS1]EIM88943.1 NAD-aldehyde dehydrogenase [Stereum hirsutum FP-91666 SS1]
MSTSSPVYTSTPVEQIPLIREELKQSFKTGKTKSIAFRKEQLLALAYLVRDNATLFEEALEKDLGRPRIETTLNETGGTISEAKLAYDMVSKWSKPDSPAFNVTWFAMKPKIRKEPKGVVLIISPFNYPLWCLLGPLAGAIAAGCACVMKPSELTPAFSALLADLVPNYLDQSLYRVINGAIPETTKLLELQWDHLLYTGGARVGKIVLAAAAQTLTPVTTELGGKSPVFIDPNTDLKLAAKRVIWGKVTNAGQTCVAPDYVLIQEDSEDKFVEACKEQLAEFYPSGALTSDSFGRIISTNHFLRIKSLMDNTKGEVVYGGKTDEAQKFIEPTIVKGIKGDDSLMREEIFGPVLPIVPVKSLDEAIDFVNERDHPLALYVFSKDPAYKAKVFDSTTSGSCLANEVMVQTQAEGLPFGGIGPSGSGAHTGKATFDMFTHQRSTLDNPAWIDLILAGRYPPYSLEKSKMMIKMSTPSLPPRPAFLNGKANGTANGGDAKKRWGKWFLFVLALALSSGGVLMQMKVLNMNMNGSGLLAALRGRLMGIGGK